jgi:hypothetical protein
MRQAAFVAEVAAVAAVAMLYGKLVDSTRAELINSRRFINLIFTINSIALKAINTPARRQFRG